MKLMGIDYGTRRLGIALSDEGGFYAFPAVVLKNDRNLIKEISNICDKEGVSEVVLGESLDYEGKPNKIMEEILELKKELEESVGAVVHLEPEYLTSVEAEHLIGDDKDKDARAAALILKSYIDKKQNAKN